MCLIVYNNKLEPEIAKEDIVVYKVFYRCKTFALGDGKIERGVRTFAPYRNFEYKDLNETYFSKEFEKNLTRDELECVNGGFHSFRVLRAAIDEMDSLSFDFHPEDTWFEVIPCIIPKGTRYYEGYFASKYSYCSEQLKINY